MDIEFTEDEIKTIKSIIQEYGSDCPGTDYEKVLELKYKLGLSIRPTPEEIAEQEKRIKAFKNTPFAKQMVELMSVNNKYLKDIDILYGTKNIKAHNLRIILLDNKKE